MKEEFQKINKKKTNKVYRFYLLAKKRWNKYIKGEEYNF